jgi:hypothetical protein
VGNRRAAKYGQRSVKDRIRAYLLDRVGEMVTSEELAEVARDPQTGKRRENWHQRLSELRVNEGYTIESWRDSARLKPGEYRLASKRRRLDAGRRLKISPATWQAVLERANFACEWAEAGETCGLRNGDIDPRGGGTVRLTPDHKRPHAVQPVIDPDDPGAWQALCGRHQIIKKNYWDHTTGKLNAYAIVQAASAAEKRRIYEFLQLYFRDR